MSGGLMSHVRYPEDLFKVQRTVLAQYHVTDPNAFFGGQDYWQVPSDPTDQSSAAGAQPPYYLTLQMPDQEQGDVLAHRRVHPQERDVVGPQRADRLSGGRQRRGFERRPAARRLRHAAPAAAPARTSWCRRRARCRTRSSPTPGSAVCSTSSGCRATKLQYGNLLTLPLANGLLYVQPVYVSASTPGAFPQLQRVLVAFGDKVGFASTLPCALDQVFGGGATGQQCTTPQPGGSGQGTTPTPTPTPSGGASPTPSPSGSASTQTAEAQLAQALNDANQAIQDRPGRP